MDKDITDITGESLLSDNYNDLTARSESLGLSDISHTSSLTRKSIPFSEINQESFSTAIGTVVPDWNPDDLNGTAESIANALYSASQQSTQQPEHPQTRHLHDENLKWKRFLDQNDAKALWHAIGWNGKLHTQPTDCPSDKNFQTHFENLLNPVRDSDPLEGLDFNQSPHIPVLDDPISVIEYDKAVKQMKPNKAAGCNGVSPGIFRILPALWIVTIITFLNICLAQSTIPIHWMKSKLITVFKKGQSHLCTNYRGIAISNSFAKLYDAILSNRLKQWYKPDPLQAGAQSGRDCVEHILCLRLLIAYAKRKKLKLWLLFIDFRQAYDRVPRDKLMEELSRAGCGGTFLRALKALYGCTKFILRSAVINATVGVKQGSPLSCLLFVFYLEQMVQFIRRLPADGFLEQLHCLLYMDDTVLLATNRRACIEKLKCVLDFCDQYGMVINQQKTKVMVINGSKDDETAITAGDLTVEHADSYWYLGSPITADGSMKTALQRHVEDKSKHILKFMTFLNYNYNMPFPLKKKVANACVLSAIL